MKGSSGLFTGRIERLLLLCVNRNVPLRCRLFVAFISQTPQTRPLSYVFSPPLDFAPLTSATRLVRPALAGVLALASAVVLSRSVVMGRDPSHSQALQVEKLVRPIHSGNGLRLLGVWDLTSEGGRFGGDSADDTSSRWPAPGLYRQRQMARIPSASGRRRS